MFDIQERMENKYEGKYYGKYTGRVVNNKIKINGVHRGDLKVEVGGILEETDKGNSSHGMQVIAKPCFAPGFFFIPQVDDMVWVEFVAGDIDFPVWTGVWYPKDAAPETAENNNPNELHGVLRTPKGHVLDLDDDGEKIVIVDANDNRVTLDDKGIVINDKSDNKITMDGAGIVIEDKSGNQIVMASGGVTVKSNAIKLGSETATEPLVLGNQWLQLFNMHMHIGNLGAPTSPPAGAGTPATPAQLSMKHKTE
jgi:hypothetical protein